MKHLTKPSHENRVTVNIFNSNSVILKCHTLLVPSSHPTSTLAKGGVHDACPRAPVGVFLYFVYTNLPVFLSLLCKWREHSRGTKTRIEHRNNWGNVVTMDPATIGYCENHQHWIFWRRSGRKSWTNCMVGNDCRPLRSFVPTENSW